MRQAFNGIVYDTDKATLLARNLPDLTGRSRYLYRTPTGLFFLYQVTDSPSIVASVGRDPKITPLTTSQAIGEYNLLEERELDFSEAFPDTDFSEA